MREITRIFDPCRVNFFLGKSTTNPSLFCLISLCCYRQVSFEGTLQSPEQILLGLDDITFSKENCSVIPNDGLKGKLLKSTTNKLIPFTQRYFEKKF